MEEKDRPDFKDPSPYLSDELNAAIIESEISGGVDLTKFPVGRTLKIQTQNTTYKLEKRVDGYYLSGHRIYCPVPTLFKVHGSSFGRSAIKLDFIGRGMRLKGHFIEKDRPLLTSKIKDIKEIKPDEKTKV